MVELPKDKTYKVKTVADLLNCPINMQPEMLKVIVDFFVKRSDLIKETGKDQIATNIKLSVTNDGVDESYIKMRQENA